MDVKQAYRHSPVHPSNRHLLGMQWRGEVFLDMVLPFGLRSAPLLFTAVADALKWAMEDRGMTWVGHYIEDFFTLGAAGSHECATNVSMMKDIFEEAGLPTKPEKEEGPATTIGVLGLELDSVKLGIRVAADKLARLKSTLEEWRGRKALKKRDLLSLIGSLSHVCKAVQTGRSFRRLIARSFNDSKKP